MKQRTRRPVVERFWDKVDMSAGPDECWPWTASVFRERNGYGKFRVSPELGVVYAHRYAYELTIGPIPDGMCACHHCDNPVCVNPAHIFIGTKRDNARDMSAKGRAPGASATHCQRGHEFSPENTYRQPGTSSRRCLTCMRAGMRRRYLNARAADAQGVRD